MTECSRLKKLFWFWILKDQIKQKCATSVRFYEIERDAQCKWIKIIYFFVSNEFLVLTPSWKSAKFILKVNHEQES